jgi:hypothetical protein
VESKILKIIRIADLRYHKHQANKVVLKIMMMVQKRKAKEANNLKRVKIEFGNNLTDK